MRLLLSVLLVAQAFLLSVGIWLLTAPGSDGTTAGIGAIVVILNGGFGALALRVLWRSA